MTAPFTPGQIERFKREAKLLRRADEISHSQALDRIAIANGYSNWSLLMKHSDTPDATEAKYTRPPFRFARTPELMRVALHKVPEPRRWGALNRTECARQQVEDISQAFVSPQNAIAFAIDYVTCLLTVPRFKIYSAAPVFWEMRAWLPYAFDAVEPGVSILVNRNYKPVGQVSKVWAKYEEFPHLHARLTEDQLKSIAAQPKSPGYVFNDGCPPWHSRAEADAYLERLARACDVLMG